MNGSPSDPTRALGSVNVGFRSAWSLGEAAAAPEMLAF